jgi:hypothetical protein
VIARAEQVLAILRAPTSELSTHLRQALSSGAVVRPTLGGGTGVDSLRGSTAAAPPLASRADYLAGFEAGRQAALAEVRLELEAFVDERLV